MATTSPPTSTLGGGEDDGDWDWGFGSGLERGCKCLIPGLVVTLIWVFVFVSVWAPGRVVALENPLACHTTLHAQQTRWRPLLNFQLLPSWHKYAFTLLLFNRQKLLCNLRYFHLKHCHHSQHHLMQQSDISLPSLVRSDRFTLSNGSLRSPVSRVPESPHDHPFNLFLWQGYMVKGFAS